MKLIYTPESIEDLKRLREFIAIKNPQVASKIGNTLLTSIRKLKDFPRLGVEVNAAPNPEIIRDLVVGNYIARYLVLESAIHILRVWHHKEIGPNM